MLYKRELILPDAEAMTVSRAVHFLRGTVRATTFAVSPREGGGAVIRYRSKDPREFEIVDGGFQVRE